MDAKTWAQIKEIFSHAVGLAEAERSAYLDQACIDDSELRREIEALLRSNDEVENFIEEPAFTVANALPTDDEPTVDKVIGHYRIVREIGRGGMGTVFLANRDDGEFQQEVAIKVVSSAFLGRESLDRFRQERQILAGLTHPNIAHLLDGGVTDDGLSYLVMEYVEGESLIKHADDHNLSIDERLQVFLKICRAFAYAHGNLIVHRDIKPSNILVTPDGEPKLLDFGLAKILDIEKDHILTASNFRALTPAYASPEQIRGETITTASDIYSLGVVLYELLSGSRPFNYDSLTFEKMIEIASGSEPEKPSSKVRKMDDVGPQRMKAKLRQSLRGDIDNIVLMAMRPEPERRYRSVEQFADDIERHLMGLPITATDDTLAYRSSKFIRRHWIGVMSVVAIGLILIAGIITTAWQAREAQQQRVRAERRFAEVRQLANSFMFEIHDSVEKLPGSTPTRNLLVTRALAYLDSLSIEATDDPSLQRELATAYEKVGDIQGNPYVGNLGDTEGALASYRKAIAIRESLNITKPDLETETEFGKSYRSLGDILEQKGDIDGSIDAYQRSLAIFERLDKAKPNDTFILDELARAHEALGDGLGRADDEAARLRSYRRTLEIRQDLLEKDPDNNKMRRSTAIAYLKVGTAEGPLPAPGEENIRKAIAILEALSAQDPSSARGRRDVGFAFYQLGNLLTKAKDFGGALDARRKALDIRQAFATDDPTNAQAKFDLAVGYADFAEALTNTGELNSAEESGRQALSIFESMVATDSSNVVYRRNLALCYEKLGDIDTKRSATEGNSNRIKRLKSARSWYQKGLNVFLQMQENGTLMPSDSGRIGQFLLKIKESDEIITRLKAL
jgi:non-specific serine/threonine protein kinase/serine/threonine-protein kinase